MSANRIIDMENYWSDDIENVLESIRHNASVMSDHHKKNYAYYKEQLKYYKIPVIIISGINSVVSVGLQPYMDQGMISAATCLLSLVCGIIGSIELFLRISDGMETELAASKDFYLLSINIYKTLTLERKRRHEGGKEYLEHVYNTYTKLIEDAQVINTKIKDKLADVPIAGGRGNYSPVQEYERGRSTKSGLNIRNTLFGPKKVPAPSEDVIVDRIVQRMTAIRTPPPDTPPPNDYGMKDMMKQFQEQSNAMTIQMKEMQKLLPKTADGLVDKTLSDLKNNGSDIASTAIDLNDNFKRQVKDTKNILNDRLIETIEEGRSAFNIVKQDVQNTATQNVKDTSDKIISELASTSSQVVSNAIEVGKELASNTKQVTNDASEVIDDIKNSMANTKKVAVIAKDFKEDLHNKITVSGAEDIRKRSSGKK